MSGRHRMVLGRYADAAEGAARLPAVRHGGAGLERDRMRMVNAAVERVRRHFGKRNRAMGNRYARVAYAYFRHRPWERTGLPERSFFHALKKVKEFFLACKQRAKPSSGRLPRGCSLQ